MTYKDFYQWINNLPSRLENRDLETYLSALYLLIEKQKDQELSEEMLLQLLQESFKSEPIEFDNKWLAIISPPDFDINIAYTEISLEEGITFTTNVLKFQIVELHKMKDKQLKNELRYFGTDSETNNRWYNFDPFTNLECGAAWLLAGKDEDQQLNVSWQMLGVLLEMGRIYE